MYKDCVITAISDLGFYGKVLVKYIEVNEEKIALKFTLNKDKSVGASVVTSGDTIIENLNFNNVNEMKYHLEKIRDRIYLIEVA